MSMHEWQNRLLATVATANAKAHAKEAEAEQEKQRMIQNRADHLDPRRRLRVCQSEAGDLQLQVRVSPPPPYSYSRWFISVCALSNFPFDQGFASP
jgi:hypothetical protein